MLLNFFLFKCVNYINKQNKNTCHHLLCFILMTMINLKITNKTAL